MIQNKALWIFPNIKESVDVLPKRLRGQAWEMIINYAFGDENVEQSCKNIKVLLAFRVVKPLLRLRGIAGSQNGKSNNPSGLAKKKEPNITPNIAPNITPIPYITETITETITEIEKKNKKEKFKKPSLEEIESYCKDRNNSISAESFYDFYESKGWKVGNTPMKDWKACVRTWEKKERERRTWKAAQGLFGVESGTYGKDIPL